VKATFILGLTTLSLLAGHDPLAAQTLPSPIEKGYITIRAGAQPERRTITPGASFSLYDETATISSSQPIKNGPMFDVTGGYRVWRRWVVAVGVSSFKSSDPATVTTSIPDPGVFDRPKVTTATTDDLDRTELGVHVQAVWFFPRSEKFDIAVSAGPSIYRVKQQLVPGVSVAPRTQNATFTVATESATAFGVNAGAEATYNLTPRQGAGIFLRYAGASTDLPGAAGVKIGGLQGGFNFRIRF
jgi:hypothetical protein